MKKMMRTLTVALLVLAMLTGVLATTASAATGSVRYIDADGTEKTRSSVEQWAPANTDDITLTSGWHTFTQSSKINALTISGEVHLILTDGVTVEVVNSVYVPAGNSITIYGQKNQTGILLANTRKSQNYSGIGGGYQKEGGTITINGGNITAYGGSQGSGIGGGYRATGNGSGDITINGGTVTAISGGSCAGIGPGGVKVSTCKITINGGVVTATGGENAAGIGADFSSGVGPITINGGTVVAKGGTGIGAGSNTAENVGRITINGGHVTAKGGEGIYVNGSGNDGAGIGGGYSDAVKEIEINGGYVVATSKNAAGIGGGRSGSGGTIWINGGTIIATGSRNAAGIGGGAQGYSGGANPSDVIITGGSIIASGPKGAIGAGASAKDKNGNALSRYTYTLNGVADGTKVTDLVGITYNETDMIVKDGQIVLYLPAGSVVTRIYVGDGSEFCIPESEGSTIFTLHNAHTVDPVYTPHETDIEKHVVTYPCCGAETQESHSVDTTGLCLCGVQVAASVNGQVYVNIDTAFAQAKAINGATLKLLSDVTISNINMTGTFTLDLNGFTLKSADNFAYAFYIDGGNLTITDTSAEQDGAVIKNAKDKDLIGVYAGSLTVHAGSFGEVIAQTSTVTVNGGTFGTLDVNTGTLVLKGGEYEVLWYAPTNLESCLVPNYYIYDASGTLVDTREIRRIENVSVKQGADLSNASIALEYTETAYTALEQKPTVVLTINGRTVPASNYIVSYSNNVNMGDATVTVTGKGIYTGTQTATFAITKGKLKVAVNPETTFEFGDTYADKAITGGKVVIVGNESAVITGTWTWVEGTDTATFTPDAQYADLFETFTETVVVTQKVTAATPILTITTPSPSIMPGMAIRMRVVAQNPHNAELTDLPTQFRITYKIGENGTPITMDGLEFTLPTTGIVLGDIVYVTVENVAVSGKYTVATSVNTIELTVGQVDYTEQIKALEEQIAALKEAHNADVSALEAELAALKAAVAALDDTYATDQELADAIAEVNKTIADLADRIQLLEETYATKAELEKAIEELEALIAAGDAASIDALNQAVRNLEEKLAKLEAAMRSDVDAIYSALDQVKAELETLITEAKTALEATLAEAVDKLEKADAENRAALEQLIADTKAALETAIAALEGRVSQNESDIAALQAALAEAIENLNKAIAEGDAANAEALAEAVATLEKALADAVAALETADETNRAALEALITEAKTTLEAALAEAVDKLEKADAENRAALEQLIADTKAALETITAALEGRVSQNETDIAGLQEALQQAIVDLNEAIISGDAALSEKIANLSTALDNAIAAYQAADKTMKAELSAKIEAADAALQAAINKLTKDLAKAEEELNAAIASGDAELDSKIAALSAALDNAIAAYQAADAAQSTELTNAMEEAVVALELAIKQVQKNLDDVKAELTAMDSQNALLATVACALSGVALCGSGAFVVWFFIDRKKRI